MTSFKYNPFKNTQIVFFAGSLIYLLCFSYLIWRYDGADSSYRTVEIILFVLSLALLAIVNVSRLRNPARKATIVVNEDGISVHIPNKECTFIAWSPDVFIKTCCDTEPHSGPIQQLVLCISNKPYNNNVDYESVDINDSVNSKHCIDFEEPWFIILKFGTKRECEKEALKLSELQQRSGI